MTREIDDITGEIVDAAVKIHMRLGPGLLESVYEMVLARELERRGFLVERQKPVSFEFDGMYFDEGFRADLLVDAIVVVELKSVEYLAPVHAKKLLTYLRLLHLPVGLLINFGGATFKEGLRRVVNKYAPNSSASPRLRVNELNQLNDENKSQRQSPMALSVFDLFKIGIGPSSSHTVGPMCAALQFVEILAERGVVEQVGRVQVDLYGSLALTGRGHATDSAVLLGLSGERPDTVNPDDVGPFVAGVRARQELQLAGGRAISFHEDTDLLFHVRESLPQHPNGLRLSAFTASGGLLAAETFFSVGGGFVVRAGDEPGEGAASSLDARILPFEFRSATELLARGRESGLSIAEMMYRNEQVRRAPAEIDAGLDRIWSVMEQCIERGCRTEGILPGGLNVRRRACRMFRDLQSEPAAADPLSLLDWVSLFALAVNEENAAGGRVVTAPTNGAAGVIPAIIAYYRRFLPGADERGVRTFLLTAAAVGMLYKRNASLSAAEMGCQGEVGVACSMAAAGLAAVMGGTNEQIENAAEIGMEHNLGLTCDPVGGLVQVPCIERNTMGATKAINAARLAVLHGDGTHRVPLDRVIETMRQTGIDMQAKYKETSLGGLAVNVVNC